MSRPVEQTTCPDCGADVTAIEGDPDPVCDACRGRRDKEAVAIAIWNGELDHLVPGLGAPLPGEEEGGD